MSELSAWSSLSLKEIFGSRQPQALFRTFVLDDGTADRATLSGRSWRPIKPLLPHHERDVVLWPEPSARSTSRRQVDVDCDASDASSMLLPNFVDVRRMLHARKRWQRTRHADFRARSSALGVRRCETGRSGRRAVTIVAAR